jgi:catechol 2,3-dioxygenase-like lactoylglutathione lyase family enzyme
MSATVTTTSTGSASQPDTVLRPGRPAMLSHAAYITHDTEKTADFFTRVLGMELVNAVLDDKIPSTGDPVPYFHSFFKMRDGSTIAFFEAPDLPLRGEAPHYAYDIFEHLAMEVDDKETVDAWYAWLVACGVEVVGPVDHKIIYSIYFHDPSGLRLEITTPLAAEWNDNAPAAKASLAEWIAVKKSAAESGTPLPEAVAELTRKRSHQAGRDINTDTID